MMTENTSEAVILYLKPVWAKYCWLKIDQLFEQHADLLAKYITVAEKLLESLKLGPTLWVSDSSNSRGNLANALIL